LKPKRNILKIKRDLLKIINVNAKTQVRMELETLINAYSESIRVRDATISKHEAFLDSFLELKEYNTELRMAIANIPLPVNPTKKNKGEKEKCKLTISIKKAKLLASKGATNPTAAAVSAPSEKKRKAEEDAPRVKRAYKKRASLVEKVTEAASQPIFNELNQTTLKEKSSEEEVDILDTKSESSEMDGDKLLAETREIKAAFAPTISDVFL